MLLVMEDKQREKQGLEIFSVRFPSEIASRAKAEAEKLGISLNAFLKMLLAQYFDGIVFQRKEKRGDDAKPTKGREEG